MIHLFVKGRVQGVGFRRWVVRAASQMGVSGWVKNNHNGDVEILADGTGEALSAFLRQCQKGPLFARVDEVVYADVTDDLPPIEAGVFTARW